MNPADAGLDETFDKALELGTTEPRAAGLAVAGFAASISGAPVGVGTAIGPHDACSWVGEGLGHVPPRVVIEASHRVSTRASTPTISRSPGGPAASVATTSWITDLTWRSKSDSDSNVAGPVHPRDRTESSDVASARDFARGCLEQLAARTGPPSDLLPSGVE